MTAPTMRERIARIIADGVGADRPSDQIADAVLAELETPTEDMECAGVCAVQDADDGASEPWDHVRTTWVAMIAEARKP